MNGDRVTVVSGEWVGSEEGEERMPHYLFHPSALFL